MKKTSIGIILPGDPDVIWNTPTWVRILYWIGRFGFLITFALGIVALYGIFHWKDDVAALALFFDCVFASCVLFLLRFSLCNEKHRCPFCFRFFQLERISDDNFAGSSSRNVSRKVTDYGTGMAYDFSGNVAFFDTARHRKEHGTETTKTFTYNLRCKNCGCVHKVEKEVRSTRF